MSEKDAPSWAVDARPASLRMAPKPALAHRDRAHRPRRPAGARRPLCAVAPAAEARAPLAEWAALRQNPEQLIRAYTPVVLSVGAKVCGRFLRPGVDDEVCIGWAALYEASRCFRPEVGVPFGAFAAMVVRRRLVDYYRRQIHLRREVPLSACEREDHEGEVWSPVDVRAAEEVAVRDREAADRREELAEFGRLLGEHGISLRDLARQSPRQRGARQRALGVARAVVAQPGWVDRLREKGGLTLRHLEQVGRALGVGRKTLERRRRYIVAMALLLAGDFPRLLAYVPAQ